MDFLTIAIISSTLAPVVLIGSWLIAPIGWPAYDSLHQTISELAAGDSPRKKPVKVAFIVTGSCHVVTAIAMPHVPTAARAMLVIGGIAAIFVALYPLPTMDSSSVAHTRSAVVHFIAMSTWPLLAVVHDSTWIQSRTGSVFSTTVMLTCFAWFAVSLRRPSLLTGIAERFLSGANVLWPLFLVLQISARLAFAS